MLPADSRSALSFRTASALWRNDRLECFQTPVIRSDGLEELAEGAEGVFVIDLVVAVRFEFGANLEPAGCPFLDMPVDHFVKETDGRTGAVEESLAIEGLAGSMDLLELPEQHEVAIEDDVGCIIT